jgi:hypothetical protein
MKTLLAISILLLIAAACAAEPMIARLPVSSPEDVRALTDMGLRVYGDEEPGYLDLVLDEAEYQHLLDLGYAPRDLVPLSLLEQDIDPEYHTYEEMVAELQALAAQYPTLCHLDTIGYSQQFQRLELAMKLSDNAAVEEDEQSVLFVGQHHGSEIMGTETIIYLISHFLSSYGSDPQVTAWMNSYEIWCLPMFNPDGHHAVTAGINLYWRKNGRDINNNQIYYEYVGPGTWWQQQHEGVNLNRNYDWFWSSDGSTDPWHYDYRGASAFSETECTAMRMLEAQQRFVASISFHSYGDVVIAPWTFGSAPAPDQDVLTAVADSLSHNFRKDNGSFFTYDIYPGQSGRFPNWFYGMGGCIAYDIELCPYPTFIPPGSQLAERTARYYNGMIYLLKRLSGPGIMGHVRDASTLQPISAQVEIQGRMSPQVRGRYAEPQHGRFTRWLPNGTYTVYSGAPGYVTRAYRNVVVANNAMTILEITLQHVDDQVVSTAAPLEIPALALSVANQSGSQVNLNLELPQSMRLSLKVYDLAGREVAALSDGWRAEGSHTVSFDASRLPSGIYFVRAAAAGMASVAKVAVVK